MTAQPFCIETSYQIKYTNKNPVPIPAIIDSLKSIEELLQRTPRFVEVALGGAKITGMEVYVSSLESGSLIEKFLIKYFFKDEANFKKAQEVIENMANGSEVVKAVVLMSVGGMMVYGLQGALGGSGAPAISMYGNTITNSVVHIGDGTTGLNPETFQKLIEKTPDKKALAKSAVEAIKPAKDDPDATIEFEGFPEQSIERSVIAEAPDEYTPPVPDEKSETYHDIRIMIRASDRDNLSSGWAGSIPGVVDGRIEFELAEGLDPKEFYGISKANADVQVQSRYDKKKKAYVPKRVVIQAIGSKLE